MTPLIIAATLAAGAAGALLRYGIMRAFRASPAKLPWAVLLVNVFGSFVAGIVVAISFTDPQSGVRLIALTGFAGGLTTFSTFGVETVQLALEGRWRTVVGSVLGNVLGGIVAFMAAWYVATALPL
jgi:CrcB protein